MKQTIEVQRPGKSPSRVVIGDVINSLENYLPEGKRVVVIADEHVFHAYRPIIGAYDYCLIGLGETNKTLATAQKLYGELLALGADRSTFILGFGGGMVGTFNQPDFVLCDLSLLQTLPEREFRAGLAEIVKAGLIADPGLFELFERHTLQEFRTDRALLLDAVTRAVHVKADIVARDEQEHGDRRKLNLGHTFAHAVEKSSREFLHGEAVAIGLVMIAALSEQNGMLSPADAARIRIVVEKMGLPLASGIELPRLLQALKLDKKKESKSVNFVLMNGVGDCLIRPFSFDEIDKIVL